MHACSVCHVLKPDHRFQLFKGRPGGWCRECKTEHARVKRAQAGAQVKVFSKVTADTKECFECKIVKPHSEFSPSARGSAGRSSYCKPCQATRSRDSAGIRETWKVNTQKYRERHKERVLTNHRLHQFVRINKRKALSDGTVTDEFVRAIYATEECYYCSACTPRKQRTLEHRVALKHNGMHSVHNIVMSCFTCNSSKGDMDESEFLTRLLLRIGREHENME